MDSRGTFGVAGAVFCGLDNIPFLPHTIASLIYRQIRSVQDICLVFTLVPNSGVVFSRTVNRYMLIETVLYDYCQSWY